MKIGIVLCSRSDSKRLPGKPFIKIKDKYLIAHLIDRACETGLPVYVAVPSYEYELYQEKLNYILNKHRGQVEVFPGAKNDPMARTLSCADVYSLDHIVRVTHDKVFVDYRQMHEFIETYLERQADYIYSTNFIDGMGFEIFSKECLERACAKYKAVEDISFAVMDVAKTAINLRSFNFNLDWLKRKTGKNKLRLLVDYKEDLETMAHVLERVGYDGKIEDVIFDEGAYKACFPLVTVYTCSYNDHQFLGQCIESVLSQSFADFEYILVDDCSSSELVPATMERYRQKDKRISVVRNETNCGLASSSNIALARARGRFVIRLDADDFFINRGVLSKMIDKIRNDGYEALYPDNLKGSIVQRGYKAHHVGGTLFRKKALDFLAFTEGLRHFEGLDLYKRIVQHQLKIGYYPEIGFYYRQRPDSLSNDLSPARLEIKEKLESGICGAELL